MKILVTGGAGYIGSHTVLELLNAGHDVVVFDSLEKSTLKNLDEIKIMTGKNISFMKGDLLSYDLASLLKEQSPNAIIHFAGYKNAGESVKEPSKYHRTNVYGTFLLLEAMRETNVNKIVFSSSCSIFGNPEKLPISEDLLPNPISAYGKSKLMVEYMLKDYEIAYGISSVALRYFNAAGAHESGKIGEEVKATGNIIPLIMENLLGHRSGFTLFGDKFNTPDGTQERDYVHVMDLANGHLKALEKLEYSEGFFFYNLGTGTPSSNKKLIELSENISGKKLAYEISGPRAGDPDFVYADPKKANTELGWTPKYSIEEIIKAAWNWHSKNLS
ncbi:UDP-glucose 4-epimerase GalE [candidate division WWE3 bacterium CG_4_9_14_0_2_um_filter_35_11]|uniref:UDP-glucose 4-epimerase n=1 Tax=candidate division WWE3 bacterium CG_4_9_14_0_2_um_filter_35_11 TaxID=1975077 RepID=A0A2M8ELT6_UNCKA|nr:MAG: UDP-glucose 4-epimerase GalE [candidate division WWE3 bacterium CG10_big_fil_rev_8_21_14_0_10_35_32]PJC23698.1 MAG: UDP-glucose 4-epimerase GalE [candidate division WWE3 bacterium CG_4_9_14_0_2_um_filter_35_11]